MFGCISLYGKINEDQYWSITIIQDITSPSIWSYYYYYQRRRLNWCRWRDREVHSLNALCNRKMHPSECSPMSRWFHCVATHRRCDKMGCSLLHLCRVNWTFTYKMYSKISNTYPIDNDRPTSCKSTRWGIEENKCRVIVAKPNMSNTDSIVDLCQYRLLVCNWYWIVYL